MTVVIEMLVGQQSPAFRYFPTRTTHNDNENENEKIVHKIK